MNVEEEVERLKEEIRRLGKIQPDGSYKNLWKLEWRGEEDPYDILGDKHTSFSGLPFLVKEFLDV